MRLSQYKRFCRTSGWYPSKNEPTSTLWSTQVLDENTYPQQMKEPVVTPPNKIPAGSKTTQTITITNPSTGAKATVLFAKGKCTKDVWYKACDKIGHKPLWGLDVHNKVVNIVHNRTTMQLVEV